MPGSRPGVDPGGAGVGMGPILRISENDKAPPDIARLGSNKISYDLGGPTYLKQPADLSEHNPSWRVMKFHRGHSKMTDIKEHMEVIGADGVHVGTVDKVEGNRIKLTKKDSGEGSHKGHHHFIDKNLVAEVEGNKVRLSAIGAVAVTMEEEK
jgi:hypothetical protein